MSYNKHEQALPRRLAAAIREKRKEKGLSLEAVAAFPATC